MEEKTEERKEHKTPHSKKDITKKLRENPWILSTFVLGIMILILLIGNLSGVFNGKSVSSNDAGNNLVTYLNNVADSEVTLVSVENDMDMYLVTVGFQGEEIPVYVTKDGKYYTTSLLPIITSTSSSNDQTISQELPKADKPKVELFIWGYCPYGVQAQGPLADVVSILKNKVDFEVILYYAGHGEFEAQQNKIQACIQEKDNDKYWDYATGFVENIYPKCGTSRDIECDKTESIKLMNSLGIDSSKIMSCVKSQGEALVSAYSKRAQEAGVSGSPTLVINGVKANPSSRTAEAFKDLICTSFNNIPEECGTELDSTTATASGNC
jgi:protein-disulfide isomerase